MGWVALGKMLPLVSIQEEVQFGVGLFAQRLGAGHTVQSMYIQVGEMGV